MADVHSSLGAASGHLMAGLRVTGKENLPGYYPPNLRTAARTAVWEYLRSKLTLAISKYGRLLGKRFVYARDMQVKFLAKIFFPM